MIHSRLTAAISLMAACVLGCAPAVQPAASPVPSAATVTAAPTAAVNDMILGPNLGMFEDARIAATLADIDHARIGHTDSTLVSFGTRHTYSDTTSTSRGIGAARRWIFAQLSQYSRECNGCLRVEFDTATMAMPYDTRGPRRITNVLAWLPGRDTSRVIVMGGHYDSCVCVQTVAGAGLPAGTAYVPRLDSTATAPGANDDGSGSSAVIELARVFSKRFPRGLGATIIFALYDAEEQGLVGSTHLAERLVKGRYDVLAGMTDDIAGNVTAADGYTDSTSMRVFGADPDTSRSRELLRFVQAAQYTYIPRFTILPVFRLDRVNRGGDHRPFVERGMPGVRFSERVENENRQHLPGDMLGFVNYPYLANLARVNAAVIGELAESPATPDSARATRISLGTSGGRRWVFSWKPVPNAASYEILVRRTTAPQYDRVIAAGNVTRIELDLQLDDYWAAVRAVGTNGHRSLGAVVPTVTRVIPRAGSAP
ncbi:MAG: peptidase [Gemmatimonadetes bacterium]|nr:peptidase [Gemmatimonadota bacterium]